MRIIGIDPGVTGALAVVRGKSGSMVVEAVYDLPTIAEKTSSGKNRRRLDPVALNKLIKDVGEVDAAVAERLVAGPAISGLAAYSLGMTAGVIGSIFDLSGLTLKLVSPNYWKRQMEIPADKGASRRAITALFNDDKFWPLAKHHNRAEAAAIAAWGIISAGK